MDGKDLFEGYGLDDMSVEAIDLGSDYIPQAPEEDTTEEVDDVQPDKGGKAPTKEVVEEDEEDVLVKRLDIEDEAESEQEEGEAPKKAKNKSYSTPSLTPYAKLLHEQDVLSSLDLASFEAAEPEAQTELLLEAMGKEMDLRIESWVNSLDPKTKRVVEFALKGVDVEEAIKVNKDIEKYSDIDPNKLGRDEELMRKVLLEYKMEMGLSEEEALDEIESMADLEKPAKNALARLTKLQEGKLANKVKVIENEKLERQKQYQDSVNKLKTYTETLNEIIPGSKLNSTVRTKVFEQMTTPIKTKDGQLVSKVQLVREEDPLKFDVTLNYLVHLTDGFKDMKKLVTLAKSSAINDLTKAIEIDEEKGREKGRTDIGNKVSANTIKTLSSIFSK